MAAEDLLLLRLADEEEVRLMHPARFSILPTCPQRPSPAHDGSAGQDNRRQETETEGQHKHYCGTVHVIGGGGQPWEEEQEHSALRTGRRLPTQGPDGQAASVEAAGLKGAAVTQK